MADCREKRLEDEEVVDEGLGVWRALFCWCFLLHRACLVVFAAATRVVSALLR